MAEYIDMTPTWEDILHILLRGVVDASPEGAKVAREELVRMAKLADKYVASKKEIAK